MPHLFIFSGGRFKFWILLAWVPHLGGASSNAENRVRTDYVSEYSYFYNVRSEH